MDTVQSLDPTNRAAAERHSVLIVGGGAAGITVAASLRRHRPALSIAIIEPADTHAYQPGWTQVGSGVFSRAQTERPEASLIPKGVTWIRAAASGFVPEENVVLLAEGRRIAYDYLVAWCGSTRRARRTARPSCARRRCGGLSRMTRRSQPSLGQHLIAPNQDTAIDWPDAQLPRLYSSLPAAQE
jgi:hypothetical protein